VQLFWVDCVVASAKDRKEELMHSVIYIIGLIVVIMFILSFLGLR